MVVDGAGNYWYSYQDLLNEFPEIIAQACWEELVIYGTSTDGVPELLDISSGDTFSDTRHVGSWDDLIDQGLFERMMYIGRTIEEDPKYASYLER